MEHLASTADLTARGIPTTETALVDALLASTSAAVRDAAGCAISRQESTVTFSTEAGRRIELPARPVVAVTSVLLDGVETTDFKLRGSSLWRSEPWHRSGCVPSELTVTFEHGFDPVPADIVNLVCMLVGAGIASAGDGFGGHRGVSSLGIDDYREAYVTGSDEVVDPTELPERTKASLRSRFGARAAVTGAVR